MSSNLEDPLNDYPLFPSLSVSNNLNDVDSLHAYLKSTALRSPNRLLEQAKLIVDSCSETMKSTILNNDVFEDKNEDAALIDKENRQERRPGLGRKRAKFTFKPNLSEPTVNLEPALDISKLKDPEDFFLAYERLENAKKELKKQRGILEDLDTDMNDISMPARPRRLGILGRKATYEHRYSSMVTNETFSASIETPEQNSPCLPNHEACSENEDPNIALQGGELAGSISKAENKVNALLDELLSGTFDDPDGSGQLKLLQIQPIQLEKLSLHDLPDIPKYDFNVFGENLPKSRNSLSDIHMKIKGWNSKTASRHGQEAESSDNLIASPSPTPPKSPFASISILKRRILQSTSLHDHDPFSALNIDVSPTKSSSVEHLDKQSDRVDKQEESSGKLKSLLSDEDNPATPHMGSTEVGMEKPTLLFDKSMDENTNTLDTCINDNLIGSCGALEEKMSTVDTSNSDNSVGSRGALREDIGESESYEWITDNYQSKHSVRTNGPNVFEEAVASAQPDANMDNPAMEGLSTGLSQSSSAFAQIHDKDPKTRGDGLEQQIENIQPQESSKRLPKDQRKGETAPGQEELSKAEARPREGRKRKECSMRQSLAGAGTFVESGVRRSSRVKRRPLEYWKGERFLYGRIHQSLPTIIGVKYISPAKCGGKQATVKVESFVSEKHKELVDLAALH